MPLFDRNHEPVDVGSIVTVKHCVGRYGETKTVSGVIAGIDQWRGIHLTLSADTKPFTEYSNLGRAQYGPGDSYYIAGAFRLVNGEMIGAYTHDDYEHGHDTYVEVAAVLNWAELGHQLRTAAHDADGGKPASPRDVREAYNFLLCNPEAFTDSDTWPASMPQEPNIELIAAYYGVV